MKLAWSVIVLVLLGTLVYAHHESWPIVKEYEMREKSCLTRRYRNVEKCTGLAAHLPKVVKAEAEECSNGSGPRCLRGRPDISGFYDPEHETIILPIGNSDTFEHEAIHHLKWLNQGDLSHDGDEWRCQ